MRAHVAQHGGLETAEAEVEIAFQPGRIPVRVREPGGRQRDGAIVAGLRKPIDDRPARISEAEQLRHLVVRLARSIVARAAQKLVAPGPLDEIQAGVAARYDEDDRWQRQ